MKDKDNWTALDTYGQTWTHLDTFGHLWTPLDRLGHLWTLIVVFGHFWPDRRVLINYLLILYLFIVYIYLNINRLKKHTVQHCPTLSTIVRLSKIGHCTLFNNVSKVKIDGQSTLITVQNCPKQIAIKKKRK